MGGREGVQDHEQNQTAGEGMGGMDPFDPFAQMFGGGGNPFRGKGSDFGGFEFRGPNGEKIDPSSFSVMGGTCGRPGGPGGPQDGHQGGGAPVWLPSPSPIPFSTMPPRSL